MDGWVDGWVDGWMDGWMDIRLNVIGCTLLQMLPKVFLPICFPSSSAPLAAINSNHLPHCVFLFRLSGYSGTG